MSTNQISMNFDKDNSELSKIEKITQYSKITTNDFTGLGLQGFEYKKIQFGEYIPLLKMP